MVCLYLQAIERYTRDWFATVVLTQFSFFIVNLYKYQNVFKSIPANTVSLYEKQCWCLIIDLVALFYDEYLEIRNKVLLITFGWFIVDVFCFGFLNKFVVCIIEKKTHYCNVNMYSQTSQIDCFRHVHKILRWIGSSDSMVFFYKKLLDHIYQTMN